MPNSTIYGEDASITKNSTTNKVNAEKAAAFDKMQRQSREQSIYNQGGNDVYSAVEQQMIRAAQQAEQDRKWAEAAARYDAQRYAPGYNPTLYEAAGDFGNWVQDKWNSAKSAANGLADYVVNAATPAPSSEAQKAAEMMKQRMLEEK